MNNHTKAIITCLAELTVAEVAALVEFVKEDLFAAAHAAVDTDEDSEILEDAIEEAPQSGKTSSASGSANS